VEQNVVITGLGVISSIGEGKEAFWRGLGQGASGVAPIVSFDPSGLPVRIAAEVRDFQPDRFMSIREAQRMDRFAQFALAAAKMAAKDGGIGVFDSDEAGVIVSSGVGGIRTLVEQQEILLRKGADRVSPFFVPMMIANSAAAQIAIQFQARGYSSAPVAACASSLNAIGEAFEVIRRGDARWMVAGGAEACILPITVAGFANMKALSRNDDPDQASRPFDRERDGFVLGEGAGILLLESEESACRRDAHIYARILAYAASNDAYHIAAPDPEGRTITRMILRALEKARLRPEEVGYVNAHGTSTPLNDRIETMALKKAFGDHAYRLRVSSTKSMIGHLLGAAGAVETIAALLPLDRGIVPPTIHYAHPDPDCDLDYVPNQSVEVRVNNVLKTSYGFGGHNACLILQRYAR
jgi:3-oxoacyl-[acyl-carrier-protein] synthase II